MNIMRSWGVENLAQSTELFAKQQVKHHSVIHLKDDMMLLFLCSKLNVVFRSSICSKTCSMQESK